MAHPLELCYNWRLPVAIASVGACGFVLALLRTRAHGWVEVVVLIALVWVGFTLVMIRRARSYLMVDGSTLVLRPWHAFVRIDGAQVRAVKQFLTPQGPSYKLTVTASDGTSSRHVAPTAWLHGGQSALFGWLLSHAPNAELDKGSRRTLDLLRVRGLIG